MLEPPLDFSLQKDETEMSSERTSAMSWFQAVGPATANYRAPK